MANIYIESHYEDLVKKKSVIKLLATRDGDLKQRCKEHINKRVDGQYPPSKSDISEGCVLETIRIQAQAAMEK
eukprot:5811112-Karenia_brevis.AAC.1